MRSQIYVSDTSIQEGNSGETTAVFSVTLAPASAVAVTVDLVTVDGGGGGVPADAGGDYTSLEETLVFAPGETSLVVNVPVYGDTADEPDETFSLLLNNAANADIIDGVGVGTILDDDGLGILTIQDASLIEGNSGTSTMVFTVTLSPVHAQTVSVNYATTSADATAGLDYIAAAGTLVFDPGETAQPIEITINADVVDEGDQETFSIDLSNPINSGLVDDAAVGTILDDDLALLSLSAPVSILEGDAGLSTAVFTVTLSTPTAFTVTVDYASSSGTGGVFATPGVDYIDANGRLTFSPGVVVKTFNILILGDLEIEPDENFSLLLTNPNPVSLYANASSGYILNDDYPLIYLPLIRRE